MATATAPASTYKGYHHLTFWVSNAKQAASYYCTRFGFTPVAYRSLDSTPSFRTTSSWVVKQQNIIFVFTSPLEPNNKLMNDFVNVHGDAVKDVAFEVNDCRAVYAEAVKRGATSIREPWLEKDENGEVIMATIGLYADVEHTFVQRNSYKGPFLPNYSAPPSDPVLSYLPPTQLEKVDHIVSNQPDNLMTPTCDTYSTTLNFHRFWSVDDSQIHTTYSALRSIVMTDESEVIKMPVNEPAPGLKKSQIQEYVEYHGGAGIQHIALRTHAIIPAVTALRQRGVEFLPIPDSYYENLAIRLSTSTTKIKEPLEKLKELQILVDYDEGGYLLQIFTKPVQDRPTLFIEIIQREGHEGFGAGNFKALFEAIEGEQERRGNL